MALAACYGSKRLSDRVGSNVAKALSGIVAEIIMIAGYFAYEGALIYGFEASVVNIPSNAVQGLVGLCVGIVMANIFEKYKLSNFIKYHF